MVNQRPMKSKSKNLLKKQKLNKPLQNGSKAFGQHKRKHRTKYGHYSKKKYIRQYGQEISIGSADSLYKHF